MIIIIHKWEIENILITHYCKSVYPWQAEAAKTRAYTPHNNIIIIHRCTWAGGRGGARTTEPVRRMRVDACSVVGVARPARAAGWPSNRLDPEHQHPILRSTSTGARTPRDPQRTTTATLRRIARKVRLLRPTVSPSNSTAAAAAAADDEGAAVSYARRSLTHRRRQRVCVVYL